MVAVEVVTMEPFLQEPQEGKELTEVVVVDLLVVLMNQLKEL